MVRVFHKPPIYWDFHKPPFEWANEAPTKFSSSLTIGLSCPGCVGLAAALPTILSIKGMSLGKMKRLMSLTVLFITLLTFRDSDDGWRKEHATSLFGNCCVPHLPNLSTPTFLTYYHVPVGFLWVLWLLPTLQQHALGVKLELFIGCRSANAVKLATCPHQ